jgi:hypothetical protein
MLGIVHPAPFNQHKVTLVGASAMFPEHVMQCSQRQALLADEQNAGCLAVEPVCQFEKLGLGRCGAKPRSPQS